MNQLIFLVLGIGVVAGVGLGIIGTRWFAARIAKRSPDPRVMAMSVTVGAGVGIVPGFMAAIVVGGDLGYTYGMIASHHQSGSAIVVLVEMALAVTACLSVGVFLGAILGAVIGNAMSGRARP